MVRARRNWAKETRWDTRRGTGRLITGSRRRGRGERLRARAVRTGHDGRREAAPESEKDEKREDGLEENGTNEDWGAGSAKEQQRQQRSKRLWRGNSNSQNVHKIPVLRDWERCSQSIGCRHWTWIGRISNTYACENLRAREQEAKHKRSSHRKGDGIKKKLRRKTPKPQAQEKLRVQDQAKPLMRHEQTGTQPERTKPQKDPWNRSTEPRKGAATKEEIVSHRTTSGTDHKDARASTIAQGPYPEENPVLASEGTT